MLEEIWTGRKPPFVSKKRGFSINTTIKSTITM